MLMNNFSLRFLSGNALKFIAAAVMLVDHVGQILLPNVLWLRYIGRLAMPIFAFLIAEGCRYTRNKLVHFLTVSGIGLACQIVYAIINPENVIFSILITFSFAILIVYALEFMKKCFVFGENTVKRCASVALFLIAVGIAYVFCHFFTVDYGFFGCILPAFAALPVSVSGRRRAEEHVYMILSFTIGLVIYVFTSGKILITFYALAAPLLLACYNGKKGKLKTKYFFYIFYPAHLAVLTGIGMLIA